MACGITAAKPINCLLVVYPSSCPILHTTELLCTTTKGVSMVTKREAEFVLAKDNASSALTTAHCKLYCSHCWDIYLRKNFFRYEEYKYITYFNISANRVYSLICHFTCDTFTEKRKSTGMFIPMFNYPFLLYKEKNCLVVLYATFPLWGEMPELIHDALSTYGFVKMK